MENMLGEKFTLEDEQTKRECYFVKPNVSDALKIINIASSSVGSGIDVEALAPIAIKYLRVSDNTNEKFIQLQNVDMFGAMFSNPFLMANVVKNFVGVLSPLIQSSTNLTVD